MFNMLTVSRLSHWDISTTWLTLTSPRYEGGVSFLGLCPFWQRESSCRWILGKLVNTRFWRFLGSIYYEELHLSRYYVQITNRLHIFAHIQLIKGIIIKPEWNYDKMWSLRFVVLTTVKTATLRILYTLNLILEKPNLESIKENVCLSRHLQGINSND